MCWGLGEVRGDVRIRMGGVREGKGRCGECEEV